MLKFLFSMGDFDLKLSAHLSKPSLVSRLSSSLSWLWSSISKPKNTRRPCSESIRRNISKEFSPLKSKKERVRARDFIGPLPPIKISEFSLLQIESLKRSLTNSPKNRKSALNIQNQSLDVIKEKSVEKKRLLKKSEIENVSNKRVKKQSDNEVVDMSKENVDVQLKKNIEDAKQCLEEEKNDSPLRRRFALRKIEKTVEPLLQICIEKVDEKLNEMKKEILKELIKSIESPITVVNPILINKQVQTTPVKSLPELEITTKEFSIAPIKVIKPMSSKKKLHSPKRSSKKSKRKPLTPIKESIDDLVMNESLSVIPEVPYMENSYTPSNNDILPNAHDIQYMNIDPNADFMSPVNSKGSERSFDSLEFTLGKRSDDEFSFGSSRKKF